MCYVCVCWLAGCYCKQYAYTQKAPQRVAERLLVLCLAARLSLLKLEEVDLGYDSLLRL